MSVGRRRRRKPAQSGNVSVAAQFAIPISVMLLTRLGGGYRVMEAKNLSPSAWRILFVILLITFFGTDFGFVYVSVAILGIFAVARAVQLLLWAGECVFRSERCPFSGRINSARLAAAAMAMVGTTLCFGGAALYSF